MPAYAGKFQLSGGAPAQGACELNFDAETLSLTSPACPPLAFDLGDIDEIAPAEWELSLLLYTGERIILRQFGAAFSRMQQELIAAWRDRTVRCLLLEDLEEVARFDCLGNGKPAEIRIYGSNLAVLPFGAPALQWRLAEIDAIHFDPSNYSFALTSPAGKITVSKLAKKTDEFHQKLRGSWDGLRRNMAVALHQTFPFLNPAAIQRLVTLAPEGRAVKLTAWQAIHAGLPDALIERAVDESLKPYFDSLRKRATTGGLAAGYKFVRPDEAAPPGDAPADGDAAANEPSDPSAATQPLFFYFFVPLANSEVVAWEATQGSGRATYFFRTRQPVDESIARLNRGLALVNFRREPVYLSDASLDREARYHRYAIGKRKLPDLAELRSAFLGRALHTSLEAWEQQLAHQAPVT